MNPVNRILAAPSKAGSPCAYCLSWVFEHFRVRGRWNGAEVSWREGPGKVRAAHRLTTPPALPNPRSPST